MPFAATWRDPDIIILSKTEKDEYHDITSMWNLKKILIQMNLFTKQKQTHRCRKQIYGYQKGKIRGGINQEFGSNIYTLLYSQQGPTVQHREFNTIFCDNLYRKII